MSAPQRTPPPPLIEAIVSALLPPARREQVLGDLAERRADPSHTNWGPELRYLMDAATVVPAAFYTCFRFWRMRQSQPLTVGTFAPSQDHVRRRVEEFQDEIWRRNGIFGLGIAVLLLESRSIVKALGLIGLGLSVLIISLSRRWWKQDRGRVLSRNLATAELLCIHRDTLTRQLDDAGLIFLLPYSLLLPLHLWWSANPGDLGPVGPLHVPQATWDSMLAFFAIASLTSIWMAIIRIQLQSEISAVDLIASGSTEG